MPLQYQVLAVNVAVALLQTGAMASVEVIKQYETVDISRAVKVQNTKLSLDSRLLEKKIILRGAIRAQKRGTPVMYIDGGKNTKEQPYENCINLIAGNPEKLKVWSKSLRVRHFYGTFITLPTISEGTYYLSYKGIELTPDCQFSSNSDNYPYFVVEKVVR